MRFYLDEHVDPAIAHALRLRGIDVTTTNDAHLAGASDELHLKFALHEDRVIVTNDVDFLRFDSVGAAHCGIAFVPRGKRRIGQVVRYLCLMHDCLDLVEMRGKVEYL